MKKSIAYALFIIAAFMGVRPAHSLTSDQHRTLQKTFDDNLVAIKRTVVNSSLSESEKIIFNKIDFRLHWTDELEAYATVENGSRIVYLSTGLLYAIQNIKATEIHSAIIPGDTCYFDYQRYIYSEIISGKTSLGKLKSPEKAAETKCICRGFSFENIISSRTWRLPVVNGSLLGSLFIMLHEVGHHVHGDVFKKDDGHTSVEIDADRWALQTAGRAGFILQPATGVFGLLLSLEAISDTPVSQKRERFDALIDGLVALLKDESIPRHLPSIAYEQALTATKEYAEWIHDTLSNKEKIEDTSCAAVEPIDYEKITLDTLHKSK